MSAENQGVCAAGGDFVVCVRIRFRQNRGIRGGADQLVERGVRRGRKILFGCGYGVFSVLIVGSFRLIEFA